MLVIPDPLCDPRDVTNPRFAIGAPPHLPENGGAEEAWRSRWKNIRYTKHATEV